MNKSLALGVAVAALFTTNAFAQKDAPQEGRPVPAAQPSPIDKAKAPAKAAKKPATPAATPAAQPGDDRPAAAPKSAVKPRKQAAKVKPGAADTKGKKNDITGPAS